MAAIEGLLKDPAGVVHVIRWPSGGGNSMNVPPHPECRIESLEIIGRNPLIICVKL